MKSPQHIYKAEFFMTSQHPRRLTVLDALRGIPVLVNKLQEFHQADQLILSQHLARLRSCKFVIIRSEKNTMFYHVHDGDVTLFLDLAKDIYGRQPGVFTGCGKPA
jgi:DNA-binding transcriptional ArsR family regulator